MVAVLLSLHDLVVCVLVLVGSSDPNLFMVEVGGGGEYPRVRGLAPCFVN